jgi:glutathione peroxidase
VPSLEFPGSRLHHDKDRALQILVPPDFCKIRLAHWCVIHASGAGFVFPPQHPRAKRTLAVFNRLSVLASLSGLAVLLALALVSVVSADDGAKKPASVLDFHVKDIDGKDVSLSSYQGKVLMIVNTASQCGLTPQYKDLEAVYEKYKSQGFEILAFPANEFGSQEPGSNEEIKTFCSTKYHVSFPLFSKIVVKGKGIHPLYDYLTSESTNGKFAGQIPWNFTMFVVNRKGEVIARFNSNKKFPAEKLGSSIETALAEK